MQNNNVKNWLACGSLNLFGRPFAGKDTQGARLAEIFDGIMISSGDVLRKAKENTEVQSIMASGGIIPSNLFESIVLPVFTNAELSGKPLILSEVGRMVGEEKVIMDAASKSGHPLKAVIYLNLSEEEVWNRFIISQVEGDRGARQDDNKAVLQTRLDKYREKVLPVIDIYRQLNLLIEVDGSKSRDDITADILSQLDVISRK